jgi:hypothetical protein
MLLDLQWSDTAACDSTNLTAGQLQTQAAGLRGFRARHRNRQNIPRILAIPSLNILELGALPQTCQPRLSVLAVHSSNCLTNLSK